MLNEHGVEHRYREYTQEPFTKAELKQILKMLGLTPAQVLRKKDAANKALGLDGTESAANLLGHMAAHPTLVQRPIAILDGRAVVGRPVEEILKLL